jgi:hypothetical protein
MKSSKEMVLLAIKRTEEALRIIDGIIEDAAPNYFGKYPLGPEALETAFAMQRKYKTIWMRYWKLIAPYNLNIPARCYRY